MPLVGGPPPAYVARPLVARSSSFLGGAFPVNDSEMVQEAFQDRTPGNGGREESMEKAATRTEPQAGVPLRARLCATCSFLLGAAAKPNCSQVCSNLGLARLVSGEKRALWAFEEGAWTWKPKRCGLNFSSP